MKSTIFIVSSNHIFNKKNKRERKLQPTFFCSQYFVNGIDSFKLHQISAHPLDPFLPLPGPTRNRMKLFNFIATRFNIYYCLLTLNRSIAGSWRLLCCGWKWMKWRPGPGRGQDKHIRRLVGGWQTYYWHFMVGNSWKNNQKGNGPPPCTSGSGRVHKSINSLIEFSHISDAVFAVDVLKSQYNATHWAKGGKSLNGKMPRKNVMRQIFERQKSGLRQSENAIKMPLTDSLSAGVKCERVPFSYCYKY